MDTYGQVKETGSFLASMHIDSPDIAIVLGTGLGRILSYVDVLCSVPYEDIPHFPLSTLELHKGHLVYGKIVGKKVLIMQGRFHAYEGHTLQEIAFPVRVMKFLGVKHLLLSNAAGGINLSLKKGDIVLVEDHINLQNGSPLVGKNVEELGPRFPDMSEPYSRLMAGVLEQEADKLGLELKKGVYAAVTGPNLETRAEYRYLRTIGADMVGMSTVPEVIAANHCDLPCAAVSVITDECNPEKLEAVNIEDIIVIAGKADERLSKLFYQAIQSL